MQCTATMPITSRLRGPSCGGREGEGCTLTAEGRAAGWGLRADGTWYPSPGETQAGGTKAPPDLDTARATRGSLAEGKTPWPHSTGPD